MGMKLCRVVSVILVLLMVAGMGVTARGEEHREPEFYVQKLLNFYRCYGSDAWDEIESLLDCLEQADAAQGHAWRGIMKLWRQTAEETELCYDSLPDHLPQDESLGIVIMGFGLNADGSIRPELEKRLQVGLTAARQYPNAALIVTGGATAQDSASTEAGMMKLWLIDHGIPADRILSEPRSYSTAQNALNVYRVLTKNRPEIQFLAIITSDYHIYRSVLDFGTVSLFQNAVAGTREIPVIAHACSDPGYPRTEELDSHAMDIAAITGIRLEFQRGTDLYSGK